MLVRDKKQVTASWLAGFIEAEGCMRQQGGSHRHLFIANTDYELIEACADYFRRNYILYNISQETKLTATGKTNYRINVSGQDCYNLLKRLESVLECRRNEANQITGSSTIKHLDSFKLDLDWLIGMWQGEGSFYIRLLRNKVIYPCLEITNTRISIIHKIESNLTNIGCMFDKVDSNRENRKPSTAFKLYGRRRCGVFLNKTRNLWFSQRDQLRSTLMLEFINSREDKYRLENYTKREMDIYYEMLNLNI